jgi:hypothetical protein
MLKICVPTPTVVLQAAHLAATTSFMVRVALFLAIAAPSEPFSNAHSLHTTVIQPRGVLQGLLEAINDFDGLPSQNTAVAQSSGKRYLPFRPCKRNPGITGGSEGARKRNIGDSRHEPGTAYADTKQEPDGHAV